MNPIRSVACTLRALDALRPYASGLRQRIELAGLMEKCEPFTMVSRERMGTLYQLVKRLDQEGIRGDLVECGVCNGGTAGIIACASADSSLPRVVRLFDSFEGLPEPSAETDGPKALAEWAPGMDLGSIDKVRELFAALRIGEERVRIVPGWFEDTLPGYAMPEVGLLHVDADWYESVKLVLETFYPNVVPGGFVVLDDYGHWEGCRTAVDEFLVARRISVDLTEVDYTGRYFRKPREA